MYTTNIPAGPTMHSHKKYGGMLSNIDLRREINGLESKIKAFNTADPILEADNNSVWSLCDQFTFVSDDESD